MVEEELKSLEWFEQFRTLDDWEFDPQLTVFLTNRINLPFHDPENITENAYWDLMQTGIDAYGTSEYGDDAHKYFFSAMTWNLRNLSYLITTPEGGKFTDDYWYILNVVLLMLVREGEQFQRLRFDSLLNHYPNSIQIGLLKAVIQSYEEDQTLMGGVILEENISRTRDHILHTGKMADYLSPTSREIAGYLSFFKVGTSFEIWMGDLTPRIHQKGRVISHVHDLFVTHGADNREGLLSVGEKSINPYQEFERIMAVIMNPSLINGWEFRRVGQMLELIQSRLGDEWWAWRDVMREEVVAGAKHLSHLSYVPNWFKAMMVEERTRLNMQTKGLKISKSMSASEWFN